MKRAYTVLILGWLAISAAFVFAAEKNWLATTKGQQQLRNAFSAGGLFGVPRYTTALLPACDSTQAGSLASDTTSLLLNHCNGTSWFPNALILTAATMTAESVAQERVAISSYTWTNAQVVALGASLTGDITVATLPAKTQVRNAYVIITGQAAGPATVTVSLGDAVGGTPFTNYIVPSNAKAAANTVYGDAAAERGTGIDVEFYGIPSYTGTTLVTAHFISTVSNLDQTTGSTGRVILETALLP